MERDRIIAEVAKRHGVLLPPDDPILQIGTILELYAADHDEREQRLSDRDAAVLAEMRQILSAIQAAGASAQAIAGRPLITSTQIRFDVLPHVLAAFKLAQIIGGVALLALAFGAGAAWDYWTTPAPPPLICDGQMNGRPVCYRFDGPAPPPAMQPDAGPAQTPSRPPSTGKGKP